MKEKIEPEFLIDYIRKWCRILYKQCIVRFPILLVFVDNTRNSAYLYENRCGSS